MPVSAFLSAERTAVDNPAERPIRERQLAAYHRALEYAAGRRLLEVGCGEGLGTFLLATRAASVTALDYSRVALEVARKRCESVSVQFLLMEVPPIGFPDSTFEVVVCFQMLEHLAEPNKLIDEIHRVLCKDGIALLATVNKDEIITNNPYHLSEYSPREFEKLLTNHFKTVDLYGVFGDELFAEYWKSNRSWARSFLSLDVFNLSSHLPRPLRQTLFDIISRMMRMSLKRKDPGLCDTITHENFIFRLGDFSGCLDLFAVCRK
ncbi:MAG: class I SAM-dependent methyltransferase [Candidatus Abyssobacteria bacterium SURF_17]|uniref:Class I SAM-dependent methyltransferase n=1 Tax=Candidatus Abyssobacteria bacterium SURF_17 TaxID=2093361 RepID=A0A419EZ76_9BACT|nr:MAG: class I SAM-dependent methyltransferase [Candidatus Abyssubacteria bacterium SURF_17]